ncbi:MAG: hypothetical protein M3517_11425 [Actinomycetota bacterium]|nr:hypothetical protein [Actinomycetota bacterium]
MFRKRGPRLHTSTPPSQRSPRSLRTTRDARAETARRCVEECDARLARYKATLDAGGDPIALAQWMTETRAKRAIAERDLAEAIPEPPVSEVEVRALVAQLGDITRRLAQLLAAAKSKLYDEIGVKVFWTPGADEIKLTVRPGVPDGSSRVGGGT